MTGRFGNAIDNFLIIMVAVAVVLLLVVMLGSRQSPAEAEPASGTESKHCRQTAVAGV